MRRQVFVAVSGLSRWSSRVSSSSSSLGHPSLVLCALQRRSVASDSELASVPPMDRTPRELDMDENLDSTLLNHMLPETDSIRTFTEDEEAFARRISHMPPVADISPAEHYHRTMVAGPEDRAGQKSKRRALQAKVAIERPRPRCTPYTLLLRKVAKRPLSMMQEKVEAVKSVQTAKLNYQALKEADGWDTAKIHKVKKFVEQGDVYDVETKGDVITGKCRLSSVRVEVEVLPEIEANKRRKLKLHWHCDRPRCRSKDVMCQHVMAVLLQCVNNR